MRMQNAAPHGGLFRRSIRASGSDHEETRDGKQEVGERSEKEETHKHAKRHSDKGYQQR
jgi:IS4 transposase